METNEEAIARFEEYAIKNFPTTYRPTNNFTQDDALALRRLASLAWKRLAMEDLDEEIAEYNRRNCLPEPPVNTYDDLQLWLRQQSTGYYYILFGVPIPAIGVFWAYVRGVLNDNDFVETSQKLIHERDTYIACHNIANNISDEYYADGEPFGSKTSSS